TSSCVSSSLFSTILRPPRSPLFPYTTLFRSAAIPNLRALVVGDVCLDRWCRYDPALSEPSRETGLPRVAVVSTEVTPGAAGTVRSEEHTSELQSRGHLVCRLLLEKKKHT